MRPKIPIPSGIRWDLPSKDIAALNNVSLFTVNQWRRITGHQIPRGLRKGQQKVHSSTVARYHAVPLPVWAKGVRAVAAYLGISWQAVYKAIDRKPELYGPQIDAWRNARLPIP